MGNAARKQRKAAVRNGDTALQFFHEPKRPTGRHLTRQEIQAARRKERDLFTTLVDAVKNGTEKRTTDN